jgi:hypothetical protein
MKKIRKQEKTGLWRAPFLFGIVHNPGKGFKRGVAGEILDSIAKS